jgi:hypothetical protein
VTVVSIAGASAISAYGVGWRSISRALADAPAALAGAPRGRRRVGLERAQDDLAAPGSPPAAFTA